jgi:hypothetical protein
MQFKTELHVHTSEVSHCADFNIREVADKYIEAGYTTLVLTNHYRDRVIAPLIESAGKSWAEHYVETYREMRDYAKGKLNVLFGCELRFSQHNNDYLLYGITEDFLLKHPDIHQMNYRSFSEFAREREEFCLYRRILSVTACTWLIRNISTVWRCLTHIGGTMHATILLIALPCATV